MKPAPRARPRPVRYAAPMPRPACGAGANATASGSASCACRAFTPPAACRVERLEKRIPALRAEDDGYTNHIHADDLARIVAAALVHGRPGRVYNAADDTPMKMADYFDLVADHYQIERPRRISREAAQQEISPGMLSYMAESRRIANDRIKRELGVSLRYPGVREGLEGMSDAE